MNALLRYRRSNVSLDRELKIAVHQTPCKPAKKLGMETVVGRCRRMTPYFASLRRDLFIHVKDVVDRRFGLRELGVDGLFMQQPSGKIVDKCGAIYVIRECVWIPIDWF